MDVKLKGVHRVTAKGKTYHYAWRGGPRLEAQPGTDAFLQELAEARTARKTGDRSKISGLCARYRASPEWTGLAAKTRQNWSPWLDKIQVHFGGLSLAAFERPRIVGHIKAWRDRYRATPRSADMGLQVLSRLLSFAGEEGLLAVNAAAKVSHIYRNDRSAILWTDQDLKDLEAVASPELMHAARLAALTGLRQGDLLRLNWSHVGELAIEISTGKSRGRKTTLIPLYADLKAHLKTIPKRSTRVLTNTEGRPWKTGFGASWGAAKERAAKDNPDIQPKHFHDLRGTAVTKLFIAYRAAFGEQEAKDLICEITTWSRQAVDDMIARYVSRDALLKDRIRRLDQNARRTRSVKPRVKPVG